MSVGAPMIDTGGWLRLMAGSVFLTAPAAPGGPGWRTGVGSGRPFDGDGGCAGRWRLHYRTMVPAPGFEQGPSPLNGGSSPTVAMTAICAGVHRGEISTSLLARCGP